MQRTKTKAYHGIKFPPTVLLQLHYFDPIWDVAIDSMHLLFVSPSGVLAKILQLWTVFDLKNRYLSEVHACWYK